MKIILSPSKTMKKQKHNWMTESLLFPELTQALHKIMKEYTQEDLIPLMKISNKKAEAVFKAYHQDIEPTPALALYTGTVFKQLNIQEYNQHLDYLDAHLRIMSAYYGILKYNTAITPYRLDMTMKPHDIRLYDYWQEAVDHYFEQEDIIISLASSEFSQMVNHPHMYTIDFIEYQNNQPKRNSMIVKKARGQMLHQMILHNIETIKELKELNIDGFQYNEEESSTYRIAFTRIKPIS